MMAFRMEKRQGLIAEDLIVNRVRQALVRMEISTLRTSRVDGEFGTTVDRIAEGIEETEIMPTERIVCAYATTPLRP
jgi:hypothetical protein